MLAKASQEGARRALIAKERGAARPDLRSTLAEVLGAVGSAHPAADRAVRPEDPEAFPRLGYGRCLREHG
jgi:hypothetical protein